MALGQPSPRFLVDGGREAATAAGGDASDGAEASGGIASVALVLLATFVCAALAAWASSVFLRLSPGGVALWPTNALIIAFLYKNPSLKIWQVLGAGLAGSFAARLVILIVPTIALADTAVNGVEVLLVALFLRTALRPRTGRRDAVADLLRYFAFACVLTPAISSLLFVTVFDLARWLVADDLVPDFWLTAEQAFAAHSLGLMVVGTMLMSFKPSEPPAPLNPLRTIPVLAMVAAAGCLIFCQTAFPVLFMIFPVLLLGAFVGTFETAVIAVLEVAIIAIILTHAGFGPIWLIRAGQEYRPLILQLYLFSITVTILPVAAVLLARREAETTLRESERRFRTIMEHSPTGMALMTLERRWSAVNDAMTALVGRDRPTLLTMSCQDITHPDDLAAEQRQTERLFSREISSYQLEKRYVRPDGSSIWVLRAVSLVTDETGAPQYLISQVTDIDARKRAEEATRAAKKELEESNRFLTLSSEIAHVGNWRFDMTTGRVFWSPETCRIHGVAPDCDIRDIQAALQFFHIDDRAMFARLAGGPVAGKPRRAVDARIVRPDDGSVRDVSIWGRYEFVDGVAVGIMGVMQDITDRKRIERERARLRERLRERLVMATEAGEVGIWEWIPQDNIFIGDQRMRKLCGLPPGMVDRSVESWVKSVHPEDVERLLASLQACFDGKQAYDTEFRIIQLGGEVRYIRARGSVVLEADGVARRMVGANWDVTDMRRLHEDLAQSRARAEAANDAKSRFLASMSHEIRTPMNGVLGFADLLLSGPLDDVQRRNAQLLKEAGDTLLTIINDILDFSKIEAGKLTLETIPLEIAALVGNAAEIVRGQAAAKGLALTWAIEDDVPAWVEGDPTRLRQILLNLLSNAIKFTAKGSVRLSVSRGDGACLRFAVTDTGIGIPETRQHLLFNHFSQVDQSTTRRYGGSGLGLVISKRLVEAMDGAIGVESADGRGSEFWFTARLPASQVPRAKPAPPRPVAARPGRILVADDVPMNQIIIEAMLKAAGHTVVLVADGQEAVEAVRGGCFDLVLMDMEMPVMDGLDATRALRAGGDRTCDIPIIALTANALPEQAEACRQAGMNAHLAKPINRALMLETVDAWIGKAAPPAFAAAG